MFIIGASRIALAESQGKRKRGEQLLREEGAKEATAQGRGSEGCEGCTQP